MMVARSVVASDDVGGEPDGHCEAKSAAVVVGGIYFTFKPSNGIVSGGGMIMVGGFFGARR